MEHMCKQCARLFLQNARRPVRPTNNTQLRPFSRIPPSFAGLVDLSTPMPNSPPANPSRFRKVGSDNTHTGRNEVRQSVPDPAQLLRRKAPGSPRFSMGRSGPQPRRPAFRRGNEEDEEAMFENADEEIEYIEKQLANNSGDLPDADVVCLESRHKLLTEGDKLTEEQVSILESLTDFEEVANMSEKDLKSSLERLNALTERQNEKSAEEEEAASLIDELSQDEMNLEHNQIIAKESRLKLLIEDETLLDEQRSILESLTVENLATMSEEKINTSLERLNTLTSEQQELSEADKESAATLLQEHEDGPIISDAEQELLNQLSDDNIKNLSDEEIIDIAKRLDLVGKNGELLDPSMYPISRAHFDEDVAAAQAEYDASLENEDKEEEPNEQEDDEDLDSNEKMEKYMTEVIDPSRLPTESLPYTPKEHTTEELRLDWPNTPLSGSGLTESIVQKVTWLAKRLPHGYWTPSQIAERYELGYMVRFNSDEEKETVLKLAAELANKRAATASEKSGEDVKAGDMQFESLGEREGEKGRLLDSMARGIYEEPGKQGNQVMDGVMRQLGNNETYRSEDAEKFKGRIERLIGMVGGRAKGARAEGAKGKK